jgi:hypothetical protein
VRIWLLVCSLLAMGLLMGATPPDESVLVQASDDTYVVADVAAPEDPQGLRDKNFGGLDFLKIWYASQVQEQEQIVSVGLVKFDLSEYREREIRSAHLQLFAARADLMQPVRLVDVSLAEGPWTEADASFKGLPQLSTPPLASSAVYGANVWYSWDVTPAVVRKARDGNVTLAIGLRSLESKGEEQVVFAAREAGRNAPRLMVTLAPSASPLPLMLLPAIAIAIVVAALAFGGGILMGRRRRAARGTATSYARSTANGKSKAAAVPVAPVGPVVDDLDTVIECPSCRRQIPEIAEVCPRCGAAVAVASR